jgi:repressor LexA
MESGMTHPRLGFNQPIRPPTFTAVGLASLGDTVYIYSMLTERQQQIVDFIRDQQRHRGITPSTAEIQKHFRFASPNAVSSHLAALERKGALTRSGNLARGLVLADATRGRHMVDIPIYGSIPAGMPTEEVQEANGCVSIDAATLGLRSGARLFGLKVRGDSMINAGIFDGDVAICERKEPRHRNIVAALIDDESTLKRYLVHCGRPFLRAENPKYPDLIPARELIIQGVQVALWRTLKS